MTPEERNPYPPAPPSPPPVDALEAPAWFRRWWPVVLQVAGFVLGALFLYRDVSADQNVAAIPAVLYVLMMGYLPISWAAGLLGRR